jgi:hypothetical protein
VRTLEDFGWVAVGSRTQAVVVHGTIIALVYWQPAEPNVTVNNEMIVSDAGFFWTGARSPDRHRFLFAADEPEDHDGDEWRSAREDVAEALREGAAPREISRHPRHPRQRDAISSVERPPRRPSH